MFHDGIECAPVSAAADVDPGSAAMPHPLRGGAGKPRVSGKRDSRVASCVWSAEFADVWTHWTFGVAQRPRGLEVVIITLKNQIFRTKR